MSKENRKKVLFLITKSNWGGAQRYVYDLATNLPSTEYEPIVALGGEGVLSEKLAQTGIRVIHIPGLQRDISLRKELWALFTIADIIKDVDPDVLHINSSKAGGLGAFVGRVLGVPRIIFTAHGWAFNEDRGVVAKLIIGFFHWLTIICAHHTIAVSRGLKQEMKWPLAQKKMSVVNPGRTITDFSTRAEARAELAALTPPLAEHMTGEWIGTIAELHPIKRLSQAIKAVQSVVHKKPHVRYVIIGSGQLEAELQALITDLALEKHVFLTGAIPEAARVLPAFDIFVLPSKSESFGYVLLEAGQAGVATVATEVGGVPDIITHEDTGLLVTPEDVEDLSHALNRLTEDTNLRTALAQNHKQKSLGYTVEKMVEETIPFY